MNSQWKPKYAVQFSFDSFEEREKFIESIKSKEEKTEIIIEGMDNESI